ncbi:hypothetical protein K440DRAFT_621993 [Wilcoxina mikolae CBS 423.85]|nr:hypothetical protein K440DRAFT_621993 [Wilcoxina mikolae CBS 423.85]
MTRLGSSLITLSLESYALPCGVAPALEDIRGNTDSPNRFADQTCGLVVYADGRAGVTVDHTVADCAAGFELSKWLSQLAAAAPTPTAPAQYKTPTMLRFPRLRGGPAPTKYQDSVPRLVNTLTFPLPRGVVEKGLTDFLISLALQAAVGEGVAITQSVFQRGVVNARTELVMMVTSESTEFLADKTPKTPETLASAWEARKLRIKARTFPFYLSTFLAPALSCLPESPAMETVQKVVELASGDKAEVQLTGFTVDYHHLDGVEAGLSNIYLPHQLAVFYLAKPGQGGYGEVEIAFSATGGWKEKVENVVDGFSRAWEEVVNVALSG